MARKSRKAVNQVILPAAPSEKIYRAGLYARISVETERKREADTIGNQIQLLKDFSSENLDIDVVDIYVDDDISGTDFVRPEFSRMMILIRTITSLRTSFPVIQSIVGALLLITMTAANKRIFRYPVLLPMRNSMAAIIGR